MDVINECRKALKRVDRAEIDTTVKALRNVDQIFCIGNGGGYAHAAHFAADLRKIVHKKAYSFDSVGELTARVNDDGWDQAWDHWMSTYWEVGKSWLSFVFSVGGGNDGLSANLPQAPFGIVGMNGGYHSRIVIPSTSTPVVEGCQSVIAHHIVEQLCA